MARIGKFQLSISQPGQERLSLRFLVLYHNDHRLENKKSIFCSAVLRLKVIESGQTNCWWLISYTQANRKMYTEISSEQTSLKQRGQKPAQNDVTSFLKELLTRKAFPVRFLQS